MKYLHLEIQNYKQAYDIFGPADQKNPGKQSRQNKNDAIDQ